MIWFLSGLVLVEFILSVRANARLDELEERFRIHVRRTIFEEENDDK